MPRYVNVALDTIEMGHEITAWFKPRGQAGQGGTVIDIDDGGIALECGTDRYHRTIAWDDVHHVTREVELDASECVEFHQGQCRGIVDFRSLTGLGGPARCDHHWDLRLDRREKSMERYADSDVRPPWFDESAIGEHWEEAD